MKKRSGFNIFIFFLCVSFLLMANVFPGEAREDKGKKRQYTLVVNISPPGAGYVTKTPNQANYAPGDMVTLTATATAKSDYRFERWSGDVSGWSNPVTIKMNDNKTVTANFKQTIRYTLVVNISPPGAGYVTKTPNQANYAPGDMVTLTRQQVLTIPSTIVVEMRAVRATLSHQHIHNYQFQIFGIPWW